MKPRHMPLLIILVVSMVTACGSAAVQSATPGVVVVTAGPQPSPTPPICTALPTGVSLAVEPISASAVRLSGEGFEPGEHLIVVLTSESPHHRHRIEDFSADPVAADGCFTITVDGVLPLPDATSDTWQVILIHARGAACRTVTLPAEE